jgi:hypothetical protein
MDQDDAPTPTEPAPTDAPTTDGTPEEAPATADPAGGDDGSATDGDEAPPVEATVPVEEPTDGVPTPLAAPAEGPAASAAHDVSARPKPAMAKVTPVLAAVAVAWVLKKLLTRNRA